MTNIKQAFKERALEISTGLGVIVIAVIFVFYALSVYLANSISSYKLTAVFNNVGSLTEGSKVKINGVDVGKVVEIKLNSADFTINVALDIANNINIPTNSVLEILSSGLLEPAYLFINIPNNAASTYFAKNEFIYNTKDFLSLDEKLGNIFLNINSK